MTQEEGAEELELSEMRAVDPLHDDPSIHEPLIASPSSLSPATTKNVPTQTKPSWTIYALTLSAGLSGLLFGYDTGVISSTLVSIRDDLSSRPLTTTDKSLVTAVTSLFALLSAPTTGYLADRYGRKAVIALASVLFALGAGVQAAAGAVWVMVLGRAAVGAAVGLASCATPLYITELAPADLRGRLVTVQSLFITGGQVVAYLVGWALAMEEGGWRWMVGLGAGPAVLQLGLLGMMYETPRWLVQHGRERDARVVLRKVYGAMVLDERDAAVETVTADIANELAMSSANDTFAGTAKALIHEPANRRALTIACMLQGLQQLCGFNSLMYFSATIFLLSGFSSPIGTSLSIALTNFALTMVAFAHIDSFGRRKILLRSIPFMILGLLVASAAFVFLDVSLAPGDGGEEPAKSMGAGGSTTEGKTWSVVLLVSLVLYVAAYAIGLGCVPWQQSELFPLRVRSLGSGVSTATNWSANFVIGITFLPMMEFLGGSVTFLLYAIVCVVGWTCIWRIYPETAGLELEGIGGLLENDWGVRESVRAFEARNKGVLSQTLDAG